MRWKYVADDFAWHLFSGLQSACKVITLKTPPMANQVPKREMACEKCWKTWKHKQVNVKNPAR